MAYQLTRQAYHDCYALFDKAVENGGARVPCGTESEAIFFRGRMHTARKIVREDNAKLYEVGHKMHAASEYDQFKVQLKEDTEGTWWAYVVTTAGINVDEIEPLPEEERR